MNTLSQLYKQYQYFFIIIWYSLVYVILANWFNNPYTFNSIIAYVIGIMVGYLIYHKIILNWYYYGKEKD